MRMVARYAKTAIRCQFLERGQALRVASWPAWQLLQRATMPRPMFIDAVQDPNLLRGVYDRCDQWCMYCPVTDRCLAYRCRDKSETAGSIYRNLAKKMYEAMRFLKDLSNAEGRDTPEIDAMLADDPRKHALVIVDDPLERMGRRYGLLSDAYLLSRPDFPFEMKPRAEGPTPFEVFAWYHNLIPAKIYRAILASRAAARGSATRLDEILASAKVALIGIDRSLEAVGSLAQQDDDPRIELMAAQLRRLRREVEGRFPRARTYRRPDLDLDLN